MLNYLEKFAYFLTLMTIVILLSRMVDISVFKDEGTKAFMVISFYISYLSCFTVSVINLVKFIEELNKESKK